MLPIGIVSAKGIWKKVPILQVGGPASTSPITLVIRVFLLHTEVADKDLSPGTGCIRSSISKRRVDFLNYAEQSHNKCWQMRYALRLQYNSSAIKSGLAKRVWILSYSAFFKTNVAQSFAELVLYIQKTRNLVIFYQIWWTKILECKQHFHDKTEFYLITLSAAHTLEKPCSSFISNKLGLSITKALRLFGPLTKLL